MLLICFEYVVYFRKIFKCYFELVYFYIVTVDVLIVWMTAGCMVFHSLGLTHSQIQCLHCTSESFTFLAHRMFSDDH